MENNENLVVEEAAENVEITTEETPKVFTEEEFNTKLNEVLGKKIARKEARMRKEYEKKYGDLEEVLRAGTGKESVEEMTDTFAKFYESKGIKLKEKPSYSDRDIEVLANAEANDVIQSGFEEVVEEVDRLTELGLANMTAREKAYFKALATHRQNIERQNELLKIGVTDEEYNSKEFQSFASKFNPNTPITDIFDIYNKTKPKKDIKPMGSMKQTQGNDLIKDFYTQEDIERLTEEDLKNPEVWKNVRRSMTGS